MQGSISKNGKNVSHIYKPKLITKDGEEVERVLYIESSGTQYIDTGYLPNADSNYEIDYEYTSFANDYNTLFGRGVNYNTTDIQLLSYAKVSSINKMIQYFGNTNNVQLDVQSINTRYKVKYSKTGYSSYNYSTKTTYTKGMSVTTITASNRTTYLFTGNSDNLSLNALSHLKVYDFIIKENETLIRHFIPVKYGTEYCMLDLVENKLYHNKGTGSFSGGDRVEVKKISKIITDNGIKYYLLDCLQSTGTQKIDTNINCNNIGKIETSFSIQNAIGSGGQMLYGYYHSNTASAKRGSNYLQYTQSSMYIYGGGQRNFTPSQRPIINDIYKLQMPIAKAGTGYLYNDDGTQRATVNVVGTLETGKMTLFVIGGNSTVASHYSSAKIYYFKMYDLDDNLISDLVPVEKEDGTKGMLDLVSHTFYENTGTGTFSGIKKEIILVE